MTQHSCDNHVVYLHVNQKVYM